ncbi:MAG: hypothetical protein EOM19_05575 [Candidatus Moranbacteria bacterium]|nr:hypothetical protein [Candidatus Moranbacteria bacterium]
MKRTYWWRSLILSFSGIIIFLGWLYEKKYCFANGSSECLFVNLRLSFFEPLFLLSLSLLLVSPFLFFIKDTTFLLWLKLSLIWFLLAFFLIALSPDYRGGWLGIGPTKESVSLYMGGIFFLGSLFLFVWHWLRKS